MHRNCPTFGIPVPQPSGPAPEFNVAAVLGMGAAADYAMQVGAAFAPCDGSEFCPQPKAEQDALAGLDPSPGFCGGGGGVAGEGRAGNP